MVRIAPLDHRDPSVAAKIHAVLMLAYAQEARLLGVAGFAPLDRTVADVGSSGDFHLGAVEGGEVVGALSIGPDDEPDQLRISSLVVHPHWQRRGIARALLAEALRRGAGMVLSVSTGAANTPALSLYRAFGFVPYRHGTLGAEALALVKLRTTAPRGDRSLTTPGAKAVPTPPLVTVRAPRASDFDAWLPLWHGYNAFYGRAGATALDPAVTATTWHRFLDPDEPVFARVAEADGRLVGLVHFLHHRSTTRIEDTCYLQDLFTVAEARGLGIGRRLIEAVGAAARDSGVKRVYWQTHQGNAAGRQLYDRVARHLGFIVYTLDV